MPVELRTNREIGNIIKNCPFGDVDLAEVGSKVLVTFLGSKPDKDKVTTVLSYVVLPDKVSCKRERGIFILP